MFTRITAGAFLFYKNKVLLMKRSPHKKLAPGFWSGIGGHMEIEDIKNPRALDLVETCYREVREETGITKLDIINLNLKYIAIRKDGEEIREHYFYFGEVKSEILLKKSDEGELHWIDIKDVFCLPMSLSVKESLNHWINNPKNNQIFIVNVSSKNKKV